MHCANCSAQLPQGAHACPSCGMVSSAFHGLAGSSASALTATKYAGTAQTLKPVQGGGASSLPTELELHAAPSSPMLPPTYYGSTPSYDHSSNPYDVSASNPYGDSYISSPYQTETPPPPPSIKKRKNKAALVVVLCIVLLVAAGAGVFVFALMPGTQKAKTSPQELYNKTVGTAPVMNDALNGPNNYGWDNYTGQGGNTRCFFRLDQLHSVARPTYFSPCYAKATNYQDFVLQVKMTLIVGHSGGLVFRANSTNDKGYQFRISTDGTYILNRVILDQQGNLVGDGQTVTSGSSSSILQGARQTNQLAVLAQGDTIALFINGKYVESATDNTYHSGQVGVYVDSDANAVEGAFNDLQVWKLA